MGTKGRKNVKKPKKQTLEKKTSNGVSASSRRNDTHGEK